jgi:hypothetical protein
MHHDGHPVLKTLQFDLKSTGKVIYLRLPMSSATVKIRSARSSPIIGVEVAVLLSLLLFGIPMIVLIPPGAGYDEEDHLVRVWELSRFSFLPGALPPQDMQYPIVFRDFAYRQQGSSGVITSDFWQKYLHASLYEDGVVRRELDTKSVYSPPLLLPQALTMRLFAGSLRMPALFVFFACRFASLLSYIILIWLAIRLIPFGKWILFILAASPMALFQATTVSPDAISNGIGFLFIAGSLRAAGWTRIDGKKLGSLLLLVFLLFLAKLNLIPLILLPFLLLPPTRFANRRAYLAFAGITLILFIAEVAGWNLLAAARSDALMANDADPTAQALHILSYPLSFFLTVIRDLISNGWMYLQTWINGYGYYYWTPPQIVSAFFLLALIGAVLREPIRERVDARYRLAFLLVFAGGYIATLLAVYLTFTPAGSEQILGMQGRYFVALALLPFLAIASLGWARKWTLPSSKWIFFFLALGLSLNVLGIYLAFHVPCGATFYQTGLCYQPLSRELTESRPSPVITSEMSLSQEFQVACNGFSEVRILLHPPSPGDEGMTRLILRERGGSILVERSALNNTVAPEEWYRLRFDSEWASAGNVYELIILGSNPSTGQGLQAFYTVQPEFDSGTLTENGQPVQEDLILQYGCATGLRKLWLTGKP